MKVDFLKNRSTHTLNAYRTTGTMNQALLNKFNSSSYTQIGDLITLNDGTRFKVSEIPKLNVGLLNGAVAIDNVMDFGSANYFKFTNSTGKSLAIFSMPSGALCRPASEDIDFKGYDKETEKYIHFWNKLGSGQAMMSPPGDFPVQGYSYDDIRSYLNEAGIDKGFFSVKIGSSNSEFFYSDTKQYPLYSKKEYDFRYHTMTSSDFSYNKSVFRCLEPGTEITIAGEKYTLKEDFTLDIPYGTDIYDIQIPKHTHTSKVSSGIDRMV